MNKHIEEKMKVIRDICPFYKEYGTCEQCNKDLDIEDAPCYWECMANAIINNGYSKQSEGVWRKFQNIYPRYACSACSHLFNNKEYKYCPYCGAKMKSEDKE